MRPDTSLQKRDVKDEHPGRPGSHTTIAVVTTNAMLTKSQATRIAQMAHDGLARAILPAHTMFDGDTVFVLATGEANLPEGETPFGSGKMESLTRIGASAADVFSRAIIHAMLAAETVGTFVCYRDKYPEAFL